MKWTKRPVRLGRMLQACLEYCNTQASFETENKNTVVNAQKYGMLLLRLLSHREQGLILEANAHTRLLMMPQFPARNRNAAAPEDPIYPALLALQKSLTLLSGTATFS